ncbi:MAG TPA: hypothetical protein VGW39_09000 [Chthoniobacterales bacterium]|nr:hypothetical protein [Chthoniobacterales bacterium]
MIEFVKELAKTALAVLVAVVGIIAFALSCCGILFNWPLRVDQLQCGIVLRSGTKWQTLFDFFFWLGRADSEKWTQAHALTFCALILAFVLATGSALLSSASLEKKSNVITLFFLVFVGIFFALFTNIRYETGRWLVGLIPDGSPVEDSPDRVRSLEVNLLPRNAPNDNDFCVLLKNETNEEIAYATKNEGEWYHDLIVADECALKCWPANKELSRPVVFIASTNGRKATCSKWFLYSITSREMSEAASRNGFEDMLLYRLRINANREIEMISPQIRPLR